MCKCQGGKAFYHYKNTGSITMTQDTLTDLIDALAITHMKEDT